MSHSIHRRAVLGGAAGALGVAAFGRGAFGQTLALPKSPVALNVIDVAGNLALTQKAIENYRKAKPNLVSRITFTKAPAPELPGKIKAQQDANRVDIDLVLTGTDALAAGVDQKLWMPMLPDHAGALPNLDEIYLDGAGQDAGPGPGPGRRRHLLPVRPAARIHARAGEDGADHGRRAARLGQGEQEPLPLRPPRQFRPGPHLHDGPALPPRRQRTRRTR